MKSKEKAVVDVVGALIKDKGRYLICQRLKDDHFGSMWEFPGGRVEEGESKEEALKREIAEELGVEIKIGDFVSVFEDEIPSLKIIVHFYRASILRGEIQRIECQDFKWLSPEDAAKLNLAPVDRKILDFLLCK